MATIDVLVMLLLAGTSLQATGVVAETPSLAVWIVDEQDVVPAGARARMHDEVNRIWSRYGVDVQWGSQFPSDASRFGLIVALRAARDASPLGRVERVGDFIRRQIVVSDAALRDLMDAGGAHPNDVGWPALYGRMFGRVVSHELGHLLLNSPAHSPTGLMRPRFVPRDVESAAADRFSLTPIELASLRQIGGASRTLAATEQPR